MALTALAPGAARASERQLDLAAEATRVTIALPATGHDVEGSFHLTRGSLRFDSASGAASGEIVVDATGGETGNKSRDKTMRQDVLEIVKFPEIVLAIDRVEGTVPESGKGEFTLHGTFQLHGVAHPLALPVKAEIQGTRAVAETSFAVPFVEWGLHDPSIFFLRVDPVVTVSVHAEGNLSDASGSAGGGR